MEYLDTGDVRQACLQRWVDSQSFSRLTCSAKIVLKLDAGFPSYTDSIVSGRRAKGQQQRGFAGKNWQVGVAFPDAHSEFMERTKRCKKK